MKTEQEVLEMIEQAFADFEEAYHKVKAEGKGYYNHYNQVMGYLYALCDVVGVSNQDKADRISTIWQRVNSSL